MISHVLKADTVISHTVFILLSFASYITISSAVMERTLVHLW